MKNPYDSLYQNFIQHLENLELESETEEMFVENVIRRFINQWPSQPHSEDVLDELKLEISEMLKKKIYGFFSLDDYRRHLKKRRAV